METTDRALIEKYLAQETPMELMMAEPESKKMLDVMGYTLIPPDEVCLRPALLKKIEIITFL